MNQNWEKEFEKGFFNIKWDSKIGTQDIKDYIRNLIVSQREQAVKEVLEKIKLEKKSVIEPIPNNEYGYNQAIDEIKTQITNLLR